jgi:hypothetical protein
MREGSSSTCAAIPRKAMIATSPRFGQAIQVTKMEGVRNLLLVAPSLIAAAHT